ncbi:glycosyltransferase family 2 protein [Qipengyuania sphaerica]|uniref:glycosyltransferase family 2 protein n=1 Tax=Qipengyuania sphaerica TaxID=2867243 RepID=UPI001C86D1F5|nr:glycosyltransferase [Qipengyuania sphaerica]MBX7539405.1 glycosyltransferase family 2 protein [Qipengyuania sphaerica]
MRNLPKITVAVCTYRRNEPLRTLLAALVEAANEVRERAKIGVVIVDDNPDGRARSVVCEFKNRFAGGVRYRISGIGNISVARNIAVDVASKGSDWVAMIDDDCEPTSSWLGAYLDVLEGTGADCATGQMNLRVPPGSPRWLEEQPFFDDVRFDFEDRAALDVAATNNSIIRASFLRENPQIRFLPELGKLGGEDMVFYRTAHRAGLKIRFAKAAGVWGNEPPERATLKHQILYRYWLGNSTYVTNRHFGVGRGRLFLRGAKGFVEAVVRPFARLSRRAPPQWRYGVAAAAGGVGLMSGAVGVRKKH